MNDLPNISAWSFNNSEGRWQRDGEIAEYDSLTYAPSFLVPGDWTITLPVTTEYLEILQPSSLVAIDWRDYRSVWCIGAPKLSLQADSEEPTFVYEVAGQGALSQFTRVPAFPDPTDLALAHQPVLTDTDPAPYKGPAETVALQLIQQNYAGWYGQKVIIPTSRGRGTTQTARPQMDQLLELVASIAKNGGIGLDLTLQAGSLDDTRADLAVRVWVPEDKTKDVRLTAAAGTLEAWEQAESEPTLTKAIVAGGGTGGMDRVFKIVTTPQSEADALRWGGHRVQLVDGPATFDPDELQAAGEAAILEASPSRTLALTAAEAEGLMAFTHYVPGDRGVGEVVEGNSVEDVIQSITVTVSEDGVTVDPIFGNPAAVDADLDLVEQFGLVKRSVRHLERK